MRPAVRGGTCSRTTAWRRSPCRSPPRASSLAGLSFDETRAVERADEVLARRSRPATPPGLRSTSSTQRTSSGLAVHGKREEVGALPHARRWRPPGPKSLSASQRLRSGDPKKRTLCCVRQHRDHDPALGRRVPEHLGVAKVLQPEVDDRVAGVLRPGAAAVVAEREVLRLPAVAVAGVDGDEARRSPPPRRGRCVLLVSPRPRCPRRS